MATDPKTISAAARPRSAYERFRWHAAFIGFTADDAKALKRSGPFLVAAAPRLLDAIYDLLLRDPETRPVFAGPDGKVDPQFILERRHDLTQWVVRTIDSADDPLFVDYLLQVGRRHAGVPGPRPAPRPSLGAMVERWS